MTEIYLSVIQKELLTVLRDKELYGIQIIRGINDLRKAENKRWWRGHRVGFGSFYPALHSLEKRGLIESRLEDPSPEGGVRKLYKLTDLGIQAICTQQPTPNCKFYQPGRCSADILDETPFCDDCPNKLRAFKLSLNDS